MANGTPQPVLLLPNVITAGSVVLASLTVDAKGRVTAASSAAVTGSGSVVLATSPTITTPTIASFTNATHNHQNAAGGGTLDAAAIGSGALALARGGTNADLSASGSSTAFLAQDASHVVTARAIIAADIPTLTASKISDFTSTVNTILASPPAIGGSVAAAGTFTTLGASGAITDTQSINATSTDGLVLTNTTAAANGAQQWSPRLRLTGQGWKTTATAASQAVDWIIENQPVQGTANPSTSLVISSQVNGAGYSAVITIGAAGAITSIATGSAGGCALALRSAGYGLFSPGSSNVNISASSTDVCSFSSTGIANGSARGFGWTSATAPGINSPDTALMRNAAGVVEINNGAAGTFRDLKPRSIILAGDNGAGASSTTTLTNATGTPGSTASPVGYLKIYVGTVASYVPYYQ